MTPTFTSKTVITNWNRSWILMIVGKRLRGKCHCWNVSRKLNRVVQPQLYLILLGPTKNLQWLISYSRYFDLLSILGCRLADCSKFNINVAERARIFCKRFSRYISLAPYKTAIHGEDETIYATLIHLNVYPSHFSTSTNTQILRQQN